MSNTATKAALAAGFGTAALAGGAQASGLVPGVEAEIGALALAGLAATAGAAMLLGRRDDATKTAPIRVRRDARRPNDAPKDLDR